MLPLTLLHLNFCSYVASNLPLLKTSLRRALPSYTNRLVDPHFKLQVPLKSLERRWLQRLAMPISERKTAASGEYC